MTILVQNDTVFPKTSLFSLWLQTLIPQGGECVSNLYITLLL